MLQSLKPYPGYSDSRLLWLRSVPEHWHVLRGKRLFKPIDIRSISGDEELLTVSSERGVIPRRTTTVTMFKAESYVGYKLCWPGDLVINSLWAWSRGLGITQHHGIISSAYGVYRLRLPYRNYSRYIHELVRSSPFQWELQVRSKGIWISRLQLTDEAFLDAPFPIPPEKEQAAIVRFLGYADRRVRQFILAKQKLIKLLEEEKQAIIHHAVTRGLDPKVSLKPSGVEWLGDVPEHWEVMSVGKGSHSIQTGPFGSQLHAEDYVTGGIPVINPSHMNGGRIKPAPAVAVSDEMAEELSRHKLKAGDVVVARRGDLGRCALVTETESGWLCGTGSLRIRPRPAVYSSHYLVEVLGSSGVRDALSLSSIGATMDNLNEGMVARLRLPCPPVDEQRHVISSINRQTKRIEIAEETARREISLVREYHTRLIADVVTGKLDVREAAASLPDDEALQPEVPLADEVLAGGELAELASDELAEEVFA